MNGDDRFKPPAAKLAEPPGPPGSSAPVTVRNACWLILLAMVFGYTTLLPGFRIGPPPENLTGVMADLLWILYFSALTVWLTVRIRRRTNWARWVLAVLTVLGWMLVAGAWGEISQQSPLGALVCLIVSSLEAWALWLLYTGDGRRWFAGEPA